MSQTTIYVLKLQNKKYYVGKTQKDVNIRFQEHLSGNGSEFTKLYKPIKILEIYKNCDNFDEDKYTKVYMQKYGIDNVRGGSYTSIELSETDLLALQKELKSSKDACYKCGKTGHFVNNCLVEYKTQSNYISRNLSCYRCGRNGHFINDCYVTTPIEGWYIEDEESEEDVSDEESEGEEYY